MRKKDPPPPPIHDVHWSVDMTWTLLSEVEKDENRLVLLGKRDKKENTSGDSKITVFQRIGSVVLQDSYKLNPTATGKAVKRKYDHTENSDADGNNSDNEFFEYYVPADGPNSTTTADAQSIWDEIIQKFPFFPVLHRILLSRPNVTPIAVTTGVGPRGKKTLHYQAPSDSEDDNSAPPLTPVQRQQMQCLHDILTVAAPATHHPSPSFEQFHDSPFDEDTWAGDNKKENTPLPSPPVATPAGCPPKSSALSPDILDKAKQRIAKIPKKRSMDEMLNIEHFLIQVTLRKSMDAINSRADAEMHLKSRDLLLREFSAGIWSVEEYREKLNTLENNSANSQPEPQSRPPKRVRYSPDWDEFDENDS
ncbi:hypothetical protein DFJ58DRAFT_874981 [Suillus subalutaceus]|uniref:uncharacterized protein n=1 Tax=Suillus subalutaceus TaxID=48586 RepID=UPI001B875773|nr:uncharacterized protein DFJ58DRAFT_874981 [Suillus subalutaceus]KAG1860201.1 hypothetical protein DFJ58DRAFT_874981 [Suillus subalutaceus]